MKTRIVSSLLACSFILVLLQLISLLVRPLVGVVSGIFVAIVCTLLLHFFQLELRWEWTAALATGASLLAVSIIFLSQASPPPYIWLSCILALVTSLAIVGVRRLRSRRCALCNRRLGRELAFGCPRCELLVCDHCWVFESSRCQLCEQNKVTIFPLDGRWWDRQFGPRIEHGRCQLCLTPAREIDLRACRKCGRPQCRACWDAANGQCSRCRWTVEELPESLRPYVLPGPGNEAAVSSRR